MEWYYILGIISYSIFIIQFILSMSGIDTDIDLDFDGISDFSFGDLISFKGMIHFAMGLSTFLMINGKDDWYFILGGCIIGIGFTIILYLIYRVCLIFNHAPKLKVGKDLIGTTVTIYIPCSYNKYWCLLPDGREIMCVYKDSSLKVGDFAVIESYNSDLYYITK